MHSLNRFLLIGAAILFAAAPALRAEEPKKNWTNAAEFSAVSANGNSNSSSYSGKDSFHYDWTRTRTGLDLYAGGLGTDSNNVVTAEQYNAGEKVTQKFTDKNYIFENFDWDSNRFSGFKHRYSLTGGFGRHLIEKPKDMLVGELGAGYFNEQRTAAPREEYGTGRVFFKYTRIVSETAKFIQDGEYLHNFRTPDGYRATTNTALIASVSTHLSMKFGYQWKFANRPAPGFGKSDTLTSAALIVNY